VDEDTLPLVLTFTGCKYNNACARGAEVLPSSAPTMLRVKDL
jgi:hypothetical protein